MFLCCKGNVLSRDMVKIKLSGKYGRGLSVGIYCRGSFMRFLGGRVCVYDLQLVEPYKGIHLTSANIHTLVHELGLRLKAVWPKDVYSVSSKGCQTALVLVCSGRVSVRRLKEVLLDSLTAVCTYTSVGYVVGASDKTCNACELHSINGLSRKLSAFIEYLKH